MVLRASHRPLALEHCMWLVTCAFYFAPSAVTILRKICNHPDLIEEQKHMIDDFGAVHRSGKLKVGAAVGRV